MLEGQTSSSTDKPPTHSIYGPMCMMSKQANRPWSQSAKESISLALLPHAWVVSSHRNSYCLVFTFRSGKIFVLLTMQRAWHQKLKSDWTPCDGSLGSKSEATAADALLTKFREDAVELLPVGEKDARPQLLCVEVFPGVALVGWLVCHWCHHDVHSDVEQLWVLVWCIQLIQFKPAHSNTHRSLTIPQVCNVHPATYTGL